MANFGIVAVPLAKRELAALLRTAFYFAKPVIGKRPPMEPLGFYRWSRMKALALHTISSDI